MQKIERERWINKTRVHLFMSGMEKKQTQAVRRDVYL